MENKNSHNNDEIINKWIIFSEILENANVITIGKIEKKM